jgi:tetratricopeptide (TPR) repeat protein
MTSKRPIALMGVLLLVLLAYLTRAQWEPQLQTESPRTLAPLAGENKISSLEVHRDPEGRWMATAEYFYTGAPEYASLDFELMRGDAKPSAGPTSNSTALERGTHRVTLELWPPHLEAMTTTHVVARMKNYQGPILRHSIAQAINWPDAQTWDFERHFADKTTEQHLKHAVDLIDAEEPHTLDEAKRLLERLISKDRQFDPGYVELARIAMKSNWGPEGLRQAESLLSSALEIRPDNVNAKILLGYVHTHQGRHKEAQALFVDASRTETKNLWLWANWGQLLVMQGKFELAVQKYKEAVTRPRTNDTYDRARLDAYRNLLLLLERRKDLDGMEALHKQRVQEFGPARCYGADYARFMLHQRGDAAAAITIARQGIDAGCKAQTTRDVLGLAHYAAWAATSDPSRNEMLHQARVYFPPSARLLYHLATNDRTLPAARQLIAAGESIGQQDNQKLNALAYALQERDLATARRLLRLGARPDAPIGETSMPVALLPVIAADTAGIRLMQQFGVDYSKLRYEGATAIDHAKRTGDRRLLEALDPTVRGL